MQLGAGVSEWPAPLGEILTWPMPAAEGEAEADAEGWQGMGEQAWEDSREESGDVVRSGGLFGRRQDGSGGGEMRGLEGSGGGGGRMRVGEGGGGGGKGRAVPLHRTPAQGQHAAHPHQVGAWADRVDNHPFQSGGEDRGRQKGGARVEGAGIQRAHRRQEGGGGGGEHRRDGGGGGGAGAHRRHGGGRRGVMAHRGMALRPSGGDGGWGHIGMGRGTGGSKEREGGSSEMEGGREGGGVGGSKRRASRARGSRVEVGAKKQRRGADMVRDEPLPERRGDVCESGDEGRGTDTDKYDSSDSFVSTYCAGSPSGFIA